MAGRCGECYYRIDCKNFHVLDDISSVTTHSCRKCNSGEWFYEEIRPAEKGDTEWIEWCSTGNHEVTLPKVPTCCYNCRVIICATCVRTTQSCPSCKRLSLR